MLRAPATEVAALAEAIRTAGYTAGAVHERLGPSAAAALDRGEVVPALRATAAGDRVDVLVRLFVLQRPVPAEAAAAALAPLPLPAAVAGGLLARDADQVRARLDVRPYGDEDHDWWVVSDLTAAPGDPPAPLPARHVLGVGNASLTLAQAVDRRRVGSALDLGTGCGVQSLHLTTHAASVTATDRNPRALACARLTAALSGVRFDLVEGDLVEPVRDRRFDLVVSNPPFVISPSARYLYRDAGLAGDDVSRRLMTELPGLLTGGGVAQLLASWLHVRGQNWADRVGEWVTGTGCDAWVLQREVADPAEYVGTWMRDAGESGEQRYAEWLDTLESYDVEAVGFGVVTLRRTAGAPTVAIEDVRDPLPDPLGPQVEEWLDRVEQLRGYADDERLLAARLRAAPDLRLETRSRPGPEGWQVELRELVRTRGVPTRAGVDEAGAMVVAGCDGAHPLGDLLAVLAVAWNVPVPRLHADALPAVRGLLRRGLLLPAAAGTSEGA